VSHRDRCRGDAGDLRQRRHLGHHRLGRAGGAASCPRLSRPRLPPAHANRGAARRRLPSLHRYPCAHRRAGRDPAWNSHGRHRYTFFHLAACRHATDLVMSLAGRDLTIGYSDRVVGRGLNVALERGEVLALLGPNGGGKTTLLKTLLGILTPRAGDVAIGGRSLAAISIRERARLIAYVPQVHVPTFAFTVDSVVLMGRTAHGNLFSRPSARDRMVAARVLDQFGIAHLAPRPYTMISGRARQLVLLARALAQEPQFVVLDEPTANLDFGNQGKVMREIRALAGAGHGILFTTHDPNHALRAADRAYLLRAGERVAEGTVGTVLTRERLEDLYGAPVEQLTDAATRHAAFLPGARGLTVVAPTGVVHFPKSAVIWVLRRDDGGPLSRAKTITYIIEQMTASKDNYLIRPDPLDPRLTERVSGVDQTGQAIETRVTVERALTIFLNSQEIVTAMTINDYPEYLALGYLLNQHMLLPDDVVTGVDYDEELAVVVVRTKRKTNYEKKLKKKVQTSGCAQGTVFGDLMEALENVTLPK